MHDRNKQKIVVLAKADSIEGYRRFYHGQHTRYVYIKIYCIPMLWDYMGAVAAVGLTLKEHMGTRGHDSIM